MIENNTFYASFTRKLRKHLKKIKIKNRTRKKRGRRGSHGCLPCFVKYSFFNSLMATEIKNFIYSISFIQLIFFLLGKKTKMWAITMGPL
jgi:hypothetical protein